MEDTVSYNHTDYDPYDPTPIPGHAYCIKSCDICEYSTYAETEKYVDDSILIHKLQHAET